MIKRTKKAWWAIHENRVLRAEGLSCHQPDGELQKGAWYFPSIGYTIFERGNLFETEKEAISQLKASLDSQMTTIQKIRDSLP